IFFLRKSRERSYGAERRLVAAPRTETASHPLKSVTVTVIKSGTKFPLSRSSSFGSQMSEGSSGFVDPLTSAMEGADPLSMFAAEEQTKKTSRSASKPPKESAEYFDDTFEPWSSKKMAILGKYTTSEKLSIATSFLSGPDKEKGAKAQTATVSDKVKHRLEQLDDFEEGSVQEMLNLSQQDYVHRIEELNSALVLAWEQDQRVKALKIAIQCAKLLADVSVIQFYPSKFVLITDILDTFGGWLIYNLLVIHFFFSFVLRASYDFTPEQVPESAKETCRNWFFKIASIRELIPRLYVEAAILKCYNFLTQGEHSRALGRLALMSRGCGDPLVAAYVRCYLCRVGVTVTPDFKDHLMICFDDFIQSYQQVMSDNVQNTLAVQKLELGQYLQLYMPAVNWILQCSAHKASNETLTQIVERCKEQKNRALLMNAVMSVFKPEFISLRAIEFNQIIRDSGDTIFPLHVLYRSLGSCVALSEPPNEHRLPLLNDVWKVVTKLKNPNEYIMCAETWSEFIAKNFGKREVNTILGDIIKHMTPDRAYEDHYPQLISILNKVMAHCKDFSQLFALEKFLPFIDMFQKESIKVDACKMIAECYVRSQNELTNDPIIINSLFFICKTMHDSVNSLTLEDEIRAISLLICGFIRSISFGQDKEQQLSFYVESRAAFTNIDTVLIHLIQSVNKLAMDTRQIVHGNHSRKTAAFVRACAAYCFITIPSLHSLFGRLHLYLISGRVALVNQCLSQGDAFFKAAIALLAEVPKSLEIDGKHRPTDPLLSDFMSNFISTLLIVPDSPEQGVMYLLRGLLNVVYEINWDRNSDTKARVFLMVLAMLSASVQDTFIYTVDKVDSNDTLYGSDPKYLDDLKKLSSTLVTEILKHLQTLDHPDTHRRQSVLAHEFFCCVIAHADLTSESMLNLAAKLWKLSQKHGLGDNKLSVRTLNSVKRKSSTVKAPQSGAYKQLLSQMQIQSRT
ncbi:hypothetical protein CAPTEDRAFT_99699, partial [Capitella teleta]